MQTIPSPLGQCKKTFNFMIMWICPHCHQKFVNNNQVHSCGDTVLDDFLNDKSSHTVSLFWHFVDVFQEMGKVTIHPTKSMIAFAAKTRIAYVIQLGKNFVDIVFPFQQPYHENLCFRKIAQVPGQQQYNHHLRMMQKGDINGEVKKFMKLAYDLGK
jgi:hypothetical protein